MCSGVWGEVGRGGAIGVCPPTDSKNEEPPTPPKVKVSTASPTCSGPSSAEAEEACAKKRSGKSRRRACPPLLPPLPLLLPAPAASSAITSFSVSLFLCFVMGWDG